MAARSKARKRAVDVLYAAELRGRERGDQLTDEVEVGGPPVHEYTVRLVEGVTAHAADIDRLIGTHARDWTLERLPDVDRAILRVAVWELLHAEDVPEQRRVEVAGEATILADQRDAEREAGGGDDSDGGISTNLVAA